MMKVLFCYRVFDILFNSRHTLEVDYLPCLDTLSLANLAEAAIA